MSNPFCSSRGIWKGKQNPPGYQALLAILFRKPLEQIKERRIDMKKLHPIWYVLIPDLDQAEEAIKALDKKIKEIGGNEGNERAS